MRERNVGLVRCWNDVQTAVGRSLLHAVREIHVEGASCGFTLVIQHAKHTRPIISSNLLDITNLEKTSRILSDAEELTAFALFPIFLPWLPWKK